MLKGIVFDKDGVLVDFDRTWTRMLIDMARKWAGSDEQKYVRLLDSAGYEPSTNSFAAGSVWAAGNTNDLVMAWDTSGDVGERLKLAQFINASCLDCEIIPLFPAGQLQGLFGQLKQNGLQLGLTTNDGEASAVRTMADFGLSPMLSLIVGYDSVANPKPAKDPVIAFCNHCDLVPGQLAVVGDNIHDMEMADAAQAALKIGVLSGNASADELRPHADFLLDSVMDLPHLLKSENLIEIA